MRRCGNAEMRKCGNAEVRRCGVDVFVDGESSRSMSMLIGGSAPGQGSVLAVMLSEEEAVVGTIAQQTSQPRKRKDHITKLREQTDLLVKGIRAKLAGGEDDMAEDELRRAWHAWMLAYHKRKAGIFGAHSFGWVALGSIFETLKEIEESA